jgi:hypothetical protein
MGLKLKLCLGNQYAASSGFGLCLVHEMAHRTGTLLQLSCGKSRPVYELQCKDFYVNDHLGFQTRTAMPNR